MSQSGEDGASEVRQLFNVRFKTAYKGGVRESRMSRGMLFQIVGAM